MTITPDQIVRRMLPPAEQAEAARAFDNAVAAVQALTHEPDDGDTTRAMSTVIAVLGVFVPLENAIIDRLTAEADQATAALTRASGRQKALANILDDLLRGPWESGHPGYPAVRTHWIEADRVSEWRTLLPTYAAPVQTEDNAQAGPIWRDYSLHQYGDGDSDVAVLCRSDSGCEDFEANAEGRYLTLGEAADWAKNHVAEHARRAAADTEPKPLPKRVKGATYPGCEAKAHVGGA